MNFEKEECSKQTDVILIDSCDDESEVEEIEDCSSTKTMFPCGCNTKKAREEGEPEHTLQCLLVKILRDSTSTPNIHIEQICAILSKRYKYFYDIPPYILVRMIRELIETEPFVHGGSTIILKEDDHCALLSIDSEFQEENGANHGIELENNPLATTEEDSFIVLSEKIDSKITDKDDGLTLEDSWSVQRGGSAEMCLTSGNYFVYCQFRSLFS